MHNAETGGPACPGVDRDDAPPDPPDASVPRDSSVPADASVPRDSPVPADASVPPDSPVPRLALMVVGLVLFVLGLALVVVGLLQTSAGPVLGVPPGAAQAAFGGSLVVVGLLLGRVAWRMTPGLEEGDEGRLPAEEE